MKKLIFFASLVISAACFAPHYTTWGGGTHDVVQVEQIRKIIASAPAKNLHRMSPDKQIDGIRSWLAHGPGNSILIKLNVGRPDAAPVLIVDIARDMGINVRTDAFMAVVKSYPWHLSPIKPTKSSSGNERPWWQKDR